MSHITSILPTNSSVPIENVVVAESGDDSEDEWNYIAGQEKPDQERETPVELESEHDEKESLKEVAAADNDDEEAAVVAAASAAVPEDAIITSPTPPTASLGETDFINQQSHAIAQALAEPEEACSELIEEKQDTEHPELFDLERVERSSSVAAEHDSDLGNDEDLDEEMDSQLNPDAKEFVPVSPQRTSVSSPFGNGIHNRIDLMDDDVVSQSPRKGSAIVMDDKDIVLPAENDFTEISQRPSELAANELNFDNIENGNSIDVKDVAQRPESSSSQCSYQEMNLKEAMHGDEKQELAAEVPEPESLFVGNAGDAGVVPTTNGQQFLTETDPMNMSFYNDENNPFNSNSQEVDMNAVQPLPDCLDDDVPESEFVDFVSQPIALNNQQTYVDESEELIKEFTSESEKSNVQHQVEQIVQEEPAAEPEPKPEQEPHVEQATPITDFVQELASEVTSILNEVKDQSRDAFTAIQQTMEFEAVSQTDHDADVINESDLCVEANEFVPTAPAADVDFEPVQSSGIVEPEPYTLNQSQNEVHEPFIQDQQISATSEQLIDTNPSLLKFDELSINDNVSTSEPQQQPEIETLIAPQPTEPEPEPQPQQQAEPVVESSVEPVVAAAAIAATTAAVAAAAVGVAKTAAPSKAKPSETKKTDVKGKVAPIKKTTAATTTTSKLAAKPSTTSATKTTAAPRVASRTVTSAPKVGGVAEKKTTTTSTVTRKPLSNGTGVTSTVTKKTTTTTSTVTKSAVGSTRAPLSTASKPATARTASATTTATKTTVPKPSTTAAPRVPLSARTVTKPATSTTSRVSATKTTTTSTVSSTASRVKSAPVPSTVRSTTLTKPKTSLTSDKPSVTKTSLSKVSPTKTSTLSAAKSPAAKTSLSVSSTATKTTTPTRKPLSTVTKTTPSKSPRVPTTNGVASKTKVAAKTGVAAAAVDKTKVTTNGDSKLNGHIEQNGTGAEKIIDVSAD